MHEATLAKDILERVVKLNTSEAPIGTVYLRVGEFRNVDRESLIFAFNAMRTFYACIVNAELLIEEVPLEAVCKDGHKYSPTAKLYFACPECLGPIGKIISGQELDIVALEVKETLSDVEAKSSVA